MDVEEQGFILAAGKMTRNKFSKIRKTTSQTSIYNRYSDLSDNESSIVSPEMRRKKSNNTNTTNTFKVPLAPKAKQVSQQKLSNPPVPQKPINPVPAKPIFAKITHNEIQTMRDALKPTAIFSSRIRSTGEFKLSVKTKEDKEKVIDWMKKRNIQGHTFSEKDELPLNFILNGYFFVEPEELLKTLNENNIPAVNVRNISKSNENPTFLVRFKKGTTTFDELRSQHSTIDFHKVMWNKLKKKDDRIAQCTRCQSFLHTWKYCNRQERCLKCNESHPHGECKRTSRDDGSPFCVNCQVEGHPSNWRECPHRLELLEKLKKSQPKTVRRTFTSKTNAWAPQEPSTSHQIRNYNDNFPEFSNTKNVSHNKSTGPHMRVNEPREYRPVLRNESSSQNQSADFYNVFERLENVSARFNSLRDFETTVNMYERLINELETTDNHFQRATILMRYSQEICR